MPVKRTQYDSLVSGISNAQAKERITPDKWLPQVNIPQTSWAKSAIFSLAVMVPGAQAPFQPPVTAPTPIPGAHQSNPVRLAPNTTYYLYDAIQGPTSPTFAETVYPDKWHREPVLPRWDFTRVTHLYPTTVGPISPIFAETIYPDKWHREPTLPRWDVPRVAHLTVQDEVEPILPPVVPMDLWAESSAPRFPDPVRRAYLEPAFTWSTFTQPVVPPQDNPVQSVPVFTFPTRHHLYQQDAVGPISPSFGEIIYPDKWWTEVRLPRWDTARTQHLDPALFWNTSTPASTIPVPTFFGPTQSLPVPPAPTRHHLYQQDAVGPVSPTFGETITVDKWFRETERPRWDAARNQHLYPPLALTEAPPFVVAPIDVNVTVLPNPVPLAPSRAHLFPAYVGPISPTFAERSTLDKWYQAPNLPRFDVVRVSHLYPSLAWEPFTQVPVPTWFGQTQITPVWAPPTRHHLYGSSTVFPVERITIDKWLGSYLVPQANWTRTMPTSLMPSLVESTIPIPRTQKFRRLFLQGGMMDNTGGMD